MMGTEIFQITLTLIGSPEKLSTNTEHIPTLLGSKQVDSMKKSDTKIGLISSWNLLVFTPIKQGWVQFWWTIFLNGRIMLKYCELINP